MAHSCSRFWESQSGLRFHRVIYEIREIYGLCQGIRSVHIILEMTPIRQVLFLVNYKICSRWSLILINHLYTELFFEMLIPRWLRLLRIPNASAVQNYFNIKERSNQWYSRENGQAAACAVVRREYMYICTYSPLSMRIYVRIDNMPEIQKMTADRLCIFLIYICQTYPIITTTLTIIKKNTIKWIEANDTSPLETFPLLTTLNMLIICGVFWAPHNRNRLDY